MAKKIKNPEIIFDFDNEEDLDLCGFSDEPIKGKCIATFSCSNTSNSKINEPATDESNYNNNTSNNDNNPNPELLPATSNASNSTNKSANDAAKTDIPVTIESDPKTELTTPVNSATQSELNSNYDDTLFDNISLPIVNGCAPPIDGEYLDVKRTYMLRKSTVRKLNKLKSIHPDLNTYVSTLVDLAIAFYYDHIINENNSKWFKYFFVNILCYIFQLLYF